MKPQQPTYWGSLEELEPPEGHEPAHGEFLTPPLKEPLTSMERRDFLKLMGLGSFAAAMACSRRPVEKIIPYVNKPEELTPGIPLWYASTCGECPSACGTLVKTREGRPIKIEGNAEHPINRGGLCARGQASLLNLYDPDRIREPQTVSRSDGTLTPTTWDKIDADLKAELAKIQANGGKVVMLTQSTTSPSTLALIKQLLSKFKTSQHVIHDVLVPDDVIKAGEASYGMPLIPRYRFEEAKFILSFGADFLGTWLSPVEFAKGFAAARSVDDGRLAKLAVVESGLSLTGQNADHYLPVAAGDELFVALAIAYEIIVTQKLSAYAENVLITASLLPYSVKNVSAVTGIEADVISKLAGDLWINRGKGLILGGSLNAKYGAKLQAVVNLLNSALENDGHTIDWKYASKQTTNTYTDLSKIIAEMGSGKIAAVFVGQGNPAFTLPPGLKFTKALAQVPLVVSFADRMNETTKLATHVLPGTHALESWGDAHPQEGLYNIIQPTIAPLYQNRSLQDSLLRLSGAAAENWHAYLKDQWRKTIAPHTAWEDVLRHGFVDMASDRRKAKGRIAETRTFREDALVSLPLLSPKRELSLALTTSIAMADGRFINNPWLQELPDPISKITWDNALSVSPQAAKDLGVEQGDIVSIKSSSFEATLPVHVQPKLSRFTAMVAVGYGQKDAGKIGHDVGQNVYPFQRTTKDSVEWNGLPVKIQKTGERVKLAITQGHHSIEGRNILFETTFKEFQKDPTSGLPHHAPLLSMWEGHEYKKERWGMAIDLNACIGCSGCVVACQAENNIPTVGKEQVRKGREMHWIRIDRYYSGNAENPDVVSQPMLCQQCENAPCETVCPTLATFHSDDGLNMMTYNRCVGTRYCSNNCSYKVRRFNFLEFNKDKEEPQALVLNPDVTVRSRGVMEKCTFCVQRINAGRDQAKLDDKAIADGDIKTACQQSCPANAIVFGNLNDPESRVAKLAKNGRGFRVLDDLNTRPAVTYLTKVRNS
ncbi:MAG: TAT-variant-translocated molybdopterin oxidoreductase [Deltaproteobacteria bacterium]|nr:TAT-variant-translocated molybdopterin oxidoreductase [Deltaproteobacteria bacterium]